MQQSLKRREDLEYCRDAEKAGYSKKRLRMLSVAVKGWMQSDALDWLAGDVKIHVLVRPQKSWGSDIHPSLTYAKTRISVGAQFHFIEIIMNEYISILAWKYAVLIRVAVP